MYICGCQRERIVAGETIYLFFIFGSIYNLGRIGLMKRLFLLVMLCIHSFVLSAQVEKYQTIIYTNKQVSKDIQAEMNRVRGLGSDLLNAGLSALKGIGSGYITSFVDLGINAIGSLITKDARDREAWETTVQKENYFSIRMGTLSQVSDFYDQVSYFSPMDPTGMIFDGLGCLKMEGPDTLFFVSCHINRRKIDRIVRHSKFELILDTLIVSPYHSNLPNTNLDIPFSFKERDNYVLTLKMNLMSSWMDQLPQMNKDQLLGEFLITIPVKENDLDSTGYLRYVRRKGEAPRYAVSGESFIVPRSYMAVKETDPERKNRVKHSWGTGEYKIDIVLEERCNITEQYRKEWKQDAKRRRKMEPKISLWQQTVQFVSNQKWDEITKTWVVTTLKAPASVLTDEVIKELKLDSDVAKTGAQSSSSKSSIPIKH